ncbi:MAG TPA: hypothetical protein VNU71_14585 [Burkholderiaceae bacterium]|nr:hypothetical protein [Burkholderiaceae bacterium]
MNVETILQAIVGSSVAGAGLVGSFALLRRRLSRDRTEMIKDRAEGNIIEMTIAERNEARAEARTAWMAHQAATEAVARLTAQNEAQGREIARLTTEFDAFKRLLARMYPETRKFLVSDFQAMPPS